MLAKRALKSSRTSLAWVVGGGDLGDLLAELVRCPSEVRLEDLTDVHTRGHAERVEDDLDRRSIGEVRHVLFRKDARDDALVTVAAGHLVADRELALHGDVDLDHLDDAGRELVALLHLADLLVGDLAENIDLARGHLLDLVDLLVDAGVLVGVADALEVAGADQLDGVAVEDVALVEELLVGALVVKVDLNFLAAEDGFETLEALVGENTNLIGEVALELLDLLLLDLLGALVLLLALAGEDADVDDGALDARRAGERGVANVAGLLAEDGAEELLFRSELSLALRRYLADEDVVVADLGSDADDSRLVEITQGVLADVGDIARDLFRPKLRVASFDLELLDVDRGVVVLADQLFGDEDRVLEVVTAPRHERDQNVAAEAELALLRARTVCDHLTLDDAIVLADDRLLVDAGVLVGALELRELIDVGADLTRELRGVVLAFDTDDDALGVDRVDDAVALGQDDGSGVAGGDALHTGTDERSLGDEQRHRLALHVGAHQRAVRVVVLEERNERCGDRDELLRARRRRSPPRTC